MGLEKFRQFIENNSTNSHIEGFREYENVIFNLDYSEINKEVQLVTLLSKVKKQGNATKFMNFLTDAADNYSVDLFLSAVPLSLRKNGISKKDLVAFYEKFDFISSESVKLIRPCFQHNNLSL